LRKFAQAGAMSVETRPAKPLTETGAIFGTPMYMAPEYVAGTKEIGPPADIFSLGIIAWEVLGRQRPFIELPITAAVSGRPLTPLRPIEELCKGLDKESARLLRACLDPSPSARPTAAELSAALRR
jgi:serine/threonine-protein kinase